MWAAGVCVEPVASRPPPDGPPSPAAVQPGLQIPALLPCLWAPRRTRLGAGGSAVALGAGGSALRAGLRRKPLGMWAAAWELPSPSSHSPGAWPGRAVLRARTTRHSGGVLGSRLLSPVLFADILSPTLSCLCTCLRPRSRHKNDHLFFSCCMSFGVVPKNHHLRQGIKTPPLCSPGVQWF